MTEQGSVTVADCGMHFCTSEVILAVSVRSSQRVALLLGNGKLHQEALLGMLLLLLLLLLSFIAISCIDGMMDDLPSLQLDPQRRGSSFVPLGEVLWDTRLSLIVGWQVHDQCLLA